MDLIGLIKELTSSGISDFVFVGVILLAVRYWLSELRRDISKEIDDKIGAVRGDFQQSHQELRQEIRDVRTYSEQSHTELRQEIRQARTYSEQSHQETRQEIKEIMLHLIDVRERLANIEGRLGAPTPRMSAVSPPLEAPAEEPSAQS